MIRIILGIGVIQALAIAIQFLRSKVTAVALGPAGVGVLSTVDQTVQFVAFVAAFSIPLASVKFLAAAHSEGHDEFRRSYAGFLKVVATLAVVGTSLAILLVLVVPSALGADVARYSGYMLVALLAVPAMMLAQLFSNVLAVGQRPRASAWLAVVTNTTTTIGILVGLMAAGLAGVFIGSTVAALLVAVGTILYIRKKLALPIVGDGGFPFSTVFRLDVGGFAALLYFASVSSSLAQLVPRYAVLTRHGEVEAGLLQGALVLATALGMVFNPANALYLTPMMNRRMPSLEKFAVAMEFQRKLAVILGLASLALVMFPQTALWLLFSSKFAPVGSLVFLFVVAQLVSQLAGVNQALLIGENDLKSYSIIVTAGHLTAATLAWILAAPFGIAGVAFSAIVSSLSIYAATMIRLLSRHNLPSPRHVLSLVAYATVIVALTGWICTGVEEWNAATAFVKLVVLTSFAGTLPLFLTRDERLSLFEMGRRLLPGRT